MSFNILGTGHFVPERLVLNDELSKFVNTSDEWITKRIGVKQRHIATNETTLQMGAAASKEAIKNADITPDDLDLIIGTTISPDTVSPGLACMIQKELGASCPCFDIAAACSGFVFALDIAAGFFERGCAKKILVVSSERLSGILDWSDRGTCAIFGDGAGAAVLGKGDGYMASLLHTSGNCDAINIPNHIDASPFYNLPIPAGTINMNGQDTYKFAVTTLAGDIKEIMKKASLEPDDITYIIPHQANLRIIDEAGRRLSDIDCEKFQTNIDRYGNTSSASIPILMDELNRAGKIKDGDIIILSAFGGGLSGATCAIRWNSTSERT